MWWCRALILLTTVAVAGGCGFRPMYGGIGETSEVRNELAAIKIRPIEDRVGQQVRNQLLDMLTPRGQPRRPRYTLRVVLTEQIANRAVRRTALPTRAELRLRANYVLSEFQSGRPILSQDAIAVSSYDLLESDFATLTAEEDARGRAATRIADDIRIRVASFFAARETTADGAPE